MKTICIIQARMGSKRLPNKSMLYLHGYPIIYWVYKRVLETKSLDEVVISIPDTKDNDILNDYLEINNIKVFRGDENDLVDRLLKTAKYFSADNIVRVCADNPLICSSEISRLLEIYFRSNCDYSYNHMPIETNYPDGIGAEICSIKLLEEINDKSNKLEHREHVFNYIWENKINYNIKKFDPPLSMAYPKLKLDINTIDDYRNLLMKPYNINMSAEEIIQVALKKNI
tara:strand:+ start:207 stop:890 length:684 start_codon:yes stop_codon:yes gene_type:complete